MSPMRRRLMPDGTCSLTRNWPSAIIQGISPHGFGPNCHYVHDDPNVLMKRDEYGREQSQSARILLRTQGSFTAYLANNCFQKKH